MRARNRRIDELSSTLSVGFGVRGLIDGSWGFAGSSFGQEDEIRRVVSLAAETPRANRLIQAVPIVLEQVPAYQDDWRMPMKVDPFTISTQEKTSKLAIDGLKSGADFGVR